MRFPAFASLLTAVLALSQFCSASNPSKHDCVPFSEASQHVGTTQCVSGTVLRVEEERSGVTFLKFCKEAPACPFTVIVFAGDQKKVGDIGQLEGRQIEIKGTIEDYDGRPQIVLRHTQQLGESAFVVVPPVPTDYDVERQGHYSSGKYSHPKAKKTHKKQGRPISIEDPEEPQ
jgi:DNA/RNA endonuclease YhcR with UshA esterase domain